jgi:hypothetical protein
MALFFSTLTHVTSYSRLLESLRIWNNLVNHLVNANQIIHLPALLHHLSSIVGFNYLFYSLLCVYYNFLTVLLFFFNKKD